MNWVKVLISALRQNSLFDLAEPTYPVYKVPLIVGKAKAEKH